MMLKKANQYLYVAFEILNMPTIIDNAITYAHHIIILLTRIKQAITSLQIAEVEHLLPLLTKENRNIIDILLFLREENFLGHLAIPIFVDVLFIDEQQFSDIALLETHSLVDLTVYFHQVKMLRLLVDAGANVTQTYPF
ncbi:MAG: hypothetical protein HWD59_06595 [Coxiellaceae bacterium]|nr:MAG: hypothetical protein HWD59_06595 [Coxiellaceae bacterium]